MLEDERAEELRGKILAVKGTDEGLDFIVECLKDENWRVRKTALESLLQSYQPESYVKKLIDLLYEEDNAGARNAAIEGLISAGKEVIEYLTDAFNTDNHDVRKFIVDILGAIGTKDTIPLLLKAIDDEDENVRASAIEYLGKLKEDSVVEALIKKVESSDTWIAYPAIEALGRLEDPRAVPVLLKALKDRSLVEPAIRALSMIGIPESLEHIVPFLRDSRRSIQQEVIKAIERFYKRGVSIEYIYEVLKKHLKDSAVEIVLKQAELRDPEVKTAAIVVLGILKDKRAIRYLLEIAHDEKFHDAALKGLCYLAKEHPDRIVHYLNAGFPDIRRAAAEVIASLKDRQFYTPLMQALKDTDGHVVAIAARGLGWIGDSRAVEELLKLLNHQYPDVQEAVVEALYNLRDYLDMYKLKDMLKHEDEKIRKNVALLIGRCGRVEFIDTLGFLLSDPSAQVRKAAVFAIGMLKSNKTVELLKTALTDESVEIRAIATERLASVASEDALESILLMTSDHDPYVRAASARALAGFKDRRAVEALIAMLKDPNGYVVTQAVEALAGTSNTKARQALVELLQRNTDREIKRTTILALARFKDTEELIKPFLLSDDWVLRYSAVKALREIATETALNTLRHFLDKETDPTVSEAIKETIGDTGR